jgi:Family of unknown function (DUF5684)
MFASISAETLLLLIVGVLYLAVIIFAIAGWWKVFVKAGKPGWGAIIPIYNTYLMIKVAKRPGWWLLLMLIPFVNFVILLIVMLDIAKAFQRSEGFGVGLFFLSFIFAPILGFGPAEYTK